MPMRSFDDNEYRAAFLAHSPIDANALRSALDIRKFEIDLYWKRAAYFWAFIAATLAGFIAIQASFYIAPATRQNLSVLLCNLGILFSFAWLCVNRGSKYWQENWEHHVDLLENPIQGPLYKVVLSRSSPNTSWQWFKHLLTGPSAISVSKVNQLISFFVTAIWVVLLKYSLPPFVMSAKVNWYYFTLTSLTFLACLAFISLGRTSSRGHGHRGTVRTAEISSP